MVFHIQNLEDLKKTIKISIDYPNIVGNLVSREQMYELVTDFLNKTGLINESMDILKEELICAVCGDIPLQPSLTKCHHIFCTYCLDMCLIVHNGKHCPMCQTSLPSCEYEPLYFLYDIIFAIRMKHDSQFQSWAKQEELDRFCLFNTNHLRCLYDRIIKSLENFKYSNNDEKLAEEVSNLSQGYLSLLKELPCSKADAGSFANKKLELFELSKRVLKPLEALGYVKFLGS